MTSLTTFLARPRIAQMQRAVTQLLSDNISFLAGGVAFYGLFALFPAMTAIVSIFGLAADPDVVRDQLEQAEFLFPPQVYDLLHTQLLSLLAEPNTTLSFTAVLSFFVAIYSATKGTKALLSALNTIFHVRETRSWFMQQVLAFFITLGTLVAFIIALLVVIGLPILLRSSFILYFITPDHLAAITQPLQWVRWIILAASTWLGISLLFIMGPNRPFRTQRLGRVLLGAAVSTGLWIAAAIGSAWLLQRLPHYNAAYGSLSAVTILMLWILGSAYIILLGAGIVSALDHNPKMEEIIEPQR